MSDPDRPPAPEVVQQREHVGDHEFVPVGGRIVMNRGVAVASPVGSGDPVAPRGEVPELVPPRRRKPRPAMDEHQQRTVLRPGLEVGSGMRGRDQQMPDYAHDSSPSPAAWPSVQARNLRSLIYPPVLTMSQMWMK